MAIPELLVVVISFLLRTDIGARYGSPKVPAMSSTPSTDASAYNDYASAAVDVSQAHHSARDGVFSFVRSVRDIDGNRRRQYLYSIPKNAQAFLPPTELNDRIKIRIPSPSGGKVAVIVKQDPDQQVLEIWTYGGQFLERRILLSKKLHGNIISDSAGGFGSPVWNPKETALVYAAERVAPATCSFFADEDSNNDETSKVRGGESTLGLGKTEHWGEKYSKQSATLDLYLVHSLTGKVGKVENVPGGHVPLSTSLGSFSLGQAVWSPDGKSVVYVAWDAGGNNQMPRRLGLTYCMQRPSQLCQSRIEHLMERLSNSHPVLNKTDDPFEILTPGMRVARSPRFSPVNSDGVHRLVFLSTRRPFDSHLGCFGLDAIDWKDGQPVPQSSRPIVHQVWNPEESGLGDNVAGLSFPGLFTVELPNNCFISPNHLLVTTQWGSCQKVIRISAIDGTVRLVGIGQELGSNSLLAVASDGSAFITCTTPNDPPKIAHIPPSTLLSETAIASENTTWLPDIFPCCASRFSAVGTSPTLGFTYYVQSLDDIPSIKACDEKLIVQSILMLPNKNKDAKPPVIVVPHGGPHSAYSTAYVPSNAYLCGHGAYALLFVNYRGSVGFGQASVEALPSNCGDMDVKDVIAATEQLKNSGLVDSDRIGICGGSHGGFLVAHCTSQYPDYFKAAAMRNPVVNIASMVTSTDIPDWCYYETLAMHYHWNEYRPPRRDELVAMYECSPVRSIHAVKTPTLVALGLSDLRVPPSQGLEWYHSLRSKGVPTKLLVYDDDDHAIAGVLSEADHWINIKKWFDQYLK